MVLISNTMVLKTVLPIISESLVMNFQALLSKQGKMLLIGMLVNALFQKTLLMLVENVTLVKLEIF